MTPLVQIAGPEAELMFRASRATQTAENRARIDRLLSAELDWQSFFESVERNHVAPAIAHTFQVLQPESLPRKVAETLRVRTKITTWKNRRFSDELVRLDEAFRDAGLTVLHYKGPSAAARLYGDIGLRTFNDFDFLVERDQLHQVLTLMVQQGYRNASTLSAEESAYSEREFKEYLYVRDDFRVEPHWSLTARRYPFTIDYAGLWERSVQMDLGAGSLQVLSPEDECHVLCIVGGKGVWKRYQMVTDIARCTSAFPDLDWSGLLARARSVGSERIVLLGLTLAAELAGARVPEEVRRRADRSRAVRRLAQRVVRSFSGPLPVRSLLPRSAHIFQPELFGMRERRRDRLTYFWRTTTTPTLLHQRLFPLPGALRWLYAPLVPAYDYLAFPLLGMAERLVPALAARLKSKLRPRSL
ncbi:MAG: nucleotidyltransferase family protein [Pseudomonadales bacterium]